MALPRIKESGGVVADPEAGTTPNGKQFIKIRFGFKSSRWNQDTRQWDETGKFYVQGTAWNEDAQRISQLGLRQGDQVLVEGDLITEEWEDNNGGGKRSKTAMRLKKVRRFEKSQNAQQGNAGFSNQQSGFSQQGNQPPQNSNPQGGGWNAPAADPWSTGGNTASNGGWGNPDQPPAH